MVFVNAVSTALRGVALLLLLPQLLAAGPPPVETFFKNWEFKEMTLSPDGNYLAFLRPYEKRMNIGVIDLRTKQSRLVTTVSARDIYRYWWTSNDRLLFRMVDKDGYEEGGLFAVNRDGSRPSTLIPAGDYRTRVLDLLENNDNEILVTSTYLAETAKDANHLRYP